MKHKIILGILTLTTAAFAGVGNEGEAPYVPSEVRIATFNVRYRTNKDKSPIDMDSRIPRIASIISMEQFDVVGLQENTGHDVALLPKLGAYDATSAGRNTDDCEGMAFLWRKDRFELVSRAVYWLSETPLVVGSKSWGSAYPRFALVGRFRDLTTGNCFVCINTHLDLQAEARKRQMQVALEFAQTESQFGPVFLMGDMNDTATSPAMVLAKTVLSDANEISLQAHCGPVETYNGYEQPWLGTFVNNAAKILRWCLPYASTYIKPIDPAEHLIDFIFVTDDVEVLTHTTVDTRPGGEFASDHYPVVIDVRF